MGTCCDAFDKHWILFSFMWHLSRLSQGRPRPQWDENVPYRADCKKKLTHVPLAIAILLVVFSDDMIIHSVYRRLLCLMILTNFLRPKGVEIGISSWVESFSIIYNEMPWHLVTGLCAFEQLSSVPAPFKAPRRVLIQCDTFTRVGLYVLHDCLRTTARPVLYWTSVDVTAVFQHRELYYVT